MEYNKDEIREKFKDLFEYSLDFMYINDLQGNFLDANDIALKALGYEREEIPNVSFVNLLDEENLLKAIENTRKVEKNGRNPKRNEYKLKTKDDNFIYVETYPIPLKKNGKVYAILGIGKDITERKLAEQNLKESEEKYRYLFEDSPFTIVLINTSRIIIDCNPATNRLIGYEREELIGKDFKNLSIIYPNYLPTLIQLFKKLLNKEIVHRIDMQLYNKAGDLIWANLQASLVKIGGKTIVQAIFHNITERKKAESLVNEEIIKLKELDQIRKDLISRVSHELKTPLVSVSGATELLLNAYNKDLGKDEVELIKMIEKGGKRLKYLVDNLLDVTRIEYEKFFLEKQLNDLSQLIRECAEEMNYLVKERKLILNLELPEVIFLELDKVRIEQVILNLLSNAIKNTPPNGKIMISLLKKEGKAEITVKDAGIGLTPEEMNRLFTRFGKIERYGEGLEYIDIQGSGLGLFISKEIIDLHRGKIWAESAGRNKGSKFTVILPIKQ